MGDIRNKNELRRRIDLFLHDFTSEEYKINEEFCKETMRMMAEFIGHVDNRLDSANAKIAAGRKRENELVEYRPEVTRIKKASAYIRQTSWQRTRNLPRAKTQRTATQEVTTHSLHRHHSREMMDLCPQETTASCRLYRRTAIWRNV